MIESGTETVYIPLVALFPLDNLFRADIMRAYPGLRNLEYF
jgi:hypothetical protein